MDYKSSRRDAGKGRGRRPEERKRHPFVSGAWDEGDRRTGLPTRSKSTDREERGMKYTDREERGMKYTDQEVRAPFREVRAPKRDRRTGLPTRSKSTDREERGMKYTDREVRAPFREVRAPKRDRRTGLPTRSKSTHREDERRVERYTDREERGMKYTDREVRAPKREGRAPFRKARKTEEKYNTARHSENARKRDDGYIRLNRYIAHAGVCSRREADEMIANGVIKVNGVICTELGTMVGPGDKVQFGGQTLKPEKMVYLVMNKPKGFITTADDPEDRKTVMDLIEGACKERIYPVGRLDRNTTGVLLFTNDGDLAKRLTHPSHGARKMYHVTLDRKADNADLQKIIKGIRLEDGPVSVDEAEFVEGAGGKEVGIQIHSGKNRIVRRIFEHLGYEVVKLDRVLFAEITKKDLKRGEWRFLSEKEVGFLRMNTGGETSAGKRKRTSKFTQEQLDEAEAIARADK